MDVVGSLSIVEVVSILLDNCTDCPFSIAVIPSILYFLLVEVEGWSSCFFAHSFRKDSMKPHMMEQFLGALKWSRSIHAL